MPLHKRLVPPYSLDILCHLLNYLLGRSVVDDALRAEDGADGADGHRRMVVVVTMSAFAAFTVKSQLELMPPQKVL